MTYSDKDPMYRGLLSIFSKRLLSDSIAKYAQLYCEANDSSIAIKDQDITARMTAAYNYSRYQKESMTNKEKAYQAKFTLLVLVIVIVVFIFIAVGFSYKYVKQQRKKRERIIKNHHAELKALTLRLHQKQDELELQKSLLDRIVSSKNELSVVIEGQKAKNGILANEIEALKEEIENLRKNDTVSLMMEKSRLFSNAPISSRIKHLAKHPSEKVTESEWEQLVDSFSKCFPAMYYDIRIQDDKNNDMRCRITILTIMGLRNGEQAALLDVSKQTITNNMASINRLLFGINSSRNLHSNLINHYNIVV